LILDNSTTHAPKQLERWLEEQIEIRGWAFNIQVYWLPTNASWRDQIEIRIGISRPSLETLWRPSFAPLPLCALAFLFS